MKKQPHLKGGNAERHASVLSLGCPPEYLAKLLWCGSVLVKHHPGLVTWLQVLRPLKLGQPVICRSQQRRRIGLIALSHFNFDRFVPKAIHLKVVLFGHALGDD
ncbi:hypothetical protein QP963_11510 [Corynebacterium coyleae]|nr:hypothetical protein [Corynebacterium coyleae]MDK8708015.1 hypothetical protein [Corynebacterium coyleae]MDK8734864.1 hypothetical protein [Corynebacterium coyleae]MDK8894059.1 hypothetical protein [Corynebacterium coyleae]